MMIHRRSRVSFLVDDVIVEQLTTEPLLCSHIDIIFNRKK